MSESGVPGLTPEGVKAYQIAAWAWEDPQGRAKDAQRQLDDLARPLLPVGGPALREVQDAGRMISRLAGTLDTPPATP